MLENQPVCNHCGSSRLTAKDESKNVQRYRCLDCFTSTSNTAGTVWHKTHLPPEKREAIEQAYEKGLSCRKAAEQIGVTYHTIHASYRKLKEK